MDMPERHKEAAPFWNSIGDWYAESNEAKCLWFLRTGSNILRENERLHFDDLKRWCKRAFHLHARTFLMAHISRCNSPLENAHPSR